MNGFTREIGVLLGSAFAGGMITTRLADSASAGSAFGPVFATLAIVALAGERCCWPCPGRHLSTARPAADRELAER